MAGYFLCCDLLGFSNLVRSTEPEERDEIHAGWIDEVSRLAKSHKLAKYKFFSDTLFAATGATESEFTELLSFSRDMLQNSTERGLPVRGGIALGEYQWGDSVTGRAVLDAHELEQATDWIGIACSVRIQVPKKAFEEGLLVCYPPPMKEGVVTFLGVVDWDVPDVKTLIDRMGFKKHLKEHPDVSWDVMRKVRNTADFGLYRTLLRKAGLPREVAYDNPLLALERCVRGDAPFPPEVGRGASNRVKGRPI